MKIGILSQWFDPEPGGGAIPGIYAREFARAGHDVSVLTGFPNYPDGNIYPGYKQRVRAVSHRHGVSLTRVPLFPNHNSSTTGRILNYASFAASAAAFGGAALRDVDGIWVYNSPITVSLPLLAHSRWGKTPYFLQVQDLWPDSLIGSGMFPGGGVGAVAAAAVSSLVRLTENRAGIIGVSSQSARELLLERNPRLRADRVISAPNPTDEAVFRPVDSLPPESVPDVPWKSSFTAMYVGAVGEVQGLDSVLDAAAALRSHRDIHFVIVGTGIAQPRLRARAAAEGLNNVTFVGRIDKALVPGYMATASVQLVCLAKRKFLEYTTPSKIASLLASRVPIIGQLSGDGARLIGDAGAGILAEPEDAESLAAAVLEMASLSGAQRLHYASDGRDYYDRNLSASVVASVVTTALESLQR